MSENRFRPRLEPVERRLALSGAAIVGDVNGDGVVNLADEAAFVPAYLTKVGDGFYNPRADANGDGFIGQGDALALLHHLNPPTRPIPLSVTIALAPEDRPRGHIHQHNSGGFTYKNVVTIEGRTTPGSFVFSDSSAADYSFTGPIGYADANGHFAFRQRLPDKLTNTEFLIVDPFGHRLIRAFPIRRLGS
jgi:Dockerin type I domain